MIKMKPWIATGALALVLVAGAAEAQTGDGPGAGMFGSGRGAVRRACQADVEQLCASVEPGGGRIVQCLREHQDRVSNGCKSAIASARAGRQNRQTPPPPEPGPAQPPS
jgi:hypothetical protein